MLFTAVLGQFRANSHLKPPCMVVLAETILKKGMEDLLSFFQTSLVKDFGYTDDQVIESLQVGPCIATHVNIKEPTAVLPQAYHTF